MFGAAVLQLTARLGDRCLGLCKGAGPAGALAGNLKHTIGFVQRRNGLRPTAGIEVFDGRLQLCRGTVAQRDLSGRRRGLLLSLRRRGGKKKPGCKTGAKGFTTSHVSIQP